MSREPSDDDIQSFLEFAGLDESDRPLATRALRQSNADPNQLIAEFYDDEVAFRKKYSWDESAFTADRDGSEGPISFHIESAPDHGGGGPQILHGVVPGQDTPYYSGAAPSRPPTPTKRRSPLGRAIDLTVASLPGRTAADDEDEDLKRALMESATEAGLKAPPQVSGVMGDFERPMFGPANRDEYDESQWAVIRPDNNNVSGGTPTPTSVYASARKRDPNAPALLLNDATTADHRLGSILTILHEIPLARNTLLEVGSPATSYGHNSEWWAGKPILPPHILAQMQTSAGDDMPNLAEVIALNHEVHRLMSFLDSSERSFGSTSVLCDLLLNSWDYDEALFTNLVENYGPDCIKPLMHDACTFDMGAPGRLPTEDDREVSAVSYLRLGLTEDTYNRVKTIYDIWDHELFRPALIDELDRPMEQVRMSLFAEMGEVLVVSVTDPFRSSKVEIPDTFYPERYLWSRRKEAIGIQWMRRRARSKRDEVEKRESPPDQPSIQDRVKSLEAEAKRADILMKYSETSARFRAFEQSGYDRKLYPNGAADAPCDFTPEEEERYEGLRKLGEEMNRQIEHLQKEIEEIEVEKQRCVEVDKFIGSLLTDPNKSGALTCKRYMLRGISTGKDIVYVCKRAEPTLIELADSPAAPKDQWWRLEYTANRQMPVKAETVDFSAIQNVMWDESNSFTLIYATEEAMSAPKIPLSDALQRFIKVDNRSFQKEIEQEEEAAAAVAETAGGNGDVPMETLESFDMRPRSDSVDSMATNRASVGSMDSREGDFRGEEFGGMDVDDDDLVSEVPRPVQEDVELINVESPVLGRGEQAPGLSAPPLPPPAKVDGNDEEARQERQEDVPMQEMKEVSTKPIFVREQERAQKLPDQS